MYLPVGDMDPGPRNTSLTIQENHVIVCDASKKDHHQNVLLIFNQSEQRIFNNNNHVRKIREYKRPSILAVNTSYTKLTN